MPNKKMDETYYDTLKVHPKATVAEIVAAYHTAKNAFSRDSIATYSLFNPEEAQSILAKLEEAYLHLSNLEKRREYDRSLIERTENQMDDGSLTELERMQNAHFHLKDREASAAAAHAAYFPSSTPQVVAPVAAPVLAVHSSSQAQADSSPTTSSVPEMYVVQGGRSENLEPTGTTDPAGTPAALTILTGDMLKEMREKRALSLDDVSRITKIPMKFVRAIESDSLPNLPARVYLQGFVKNLASLYKLDPQLAAKAYLAYIDNRNHEAKSAS